MARKKSIGNSAFSGAGITCRLFDTLYSGIPCHPKIVKRKGDGEWVGRGEKPQRVSEI